MEWRSAVLKNKKHKKINYETSPELVEGRTGEAITRITNQLRMTNDNTKRLLRSRRRLSLAVDRRFVTARERQRLDQSSEPHEGGSSHCDCESFSCECNDAEAANHDPSLRGRSRRSRPKQEAGSSKQSHGKARTTND